MIRAFIAVPIGAEMKGKISAVRELLKETLADIRWVGEDGIHLTLKFLGGIEEEKVPSIARRLEPLAQRASFDIYARGLGVFPDIKRAQVLWVGLEGAALGPLARQVEEALEAEGFQRERRPFRPHLTIGRWHRSGSPPEPLKRALARWQDHDFGASRVNEVVLFQSLTNPDGAVYVPLQVIRLSSRPADAEDG